MIDVPSAETNLRLRRLTLGETTELLTESAPLFSYSIGATGPRAFRLARVRRKQIVRKVTESIAVALSEDRSGTVVRFVGPIDEALVRLLEKADVPLTPDDVRSRPVASRPPAEAPTSGAAPTQAHEVVGQQGAMPSWLSSKPMEPRPITAEPVNANELDSATVARSALTDMAEGELVMPDGRTIALSKPVALGRNPSTDKSPNGTTPIRLADKLLSKTHALVEQDSSGVWVTDLHSTNGTSIEVDGFSTHLQAGQGHLVELGSVLVLGDTRLVLRALA